MHVVYKIDLSIEHILFSIKKYYRIRINVALSCALCIVLELFIWQSRDRAK